MWLFRLGKTGDFVIWAASWQNQQCGWAPNEDSDQSSLCAQWVAKGPSLLHADSEASDQTGRMHRLIWVFAGRTLTLLVLSRGGSFVSFCFLFLPVSLVHVTVIHSYFRIIVMTKWNLLSKSIETFSGKRRTKRFESGLINRKKN